MQFRGNFPHNLSCGKLSKSFCLHDNVHISNYLKVNFFHFLSTITIDRKNVSFKNYASYISLF